MGDIDSYEYYAGYQQTDDYNVNYRQNNQNLNPREALSYTQLEVPVKWENQIACNSAKEQVESVDKVDARSTLEIQPMTNGAPVTSALPHMDNVHCYASKQHNFNIESLLNNYYGQSSNSVQAYDHCQLNAPSDAQPSLSNLSSPQKQPMLIAPQNSTCSPTIQPSPSSDSPTENAPKTRRARTKFEKWQVEALEEQFAVSQYYCTGDQVIIAEKLNLPRLQVKFWFKNRRRSFKSQLKYQKPYQEPIQNSEPSHPRFSAYAAPNTQYHPYAFQPSGYGMQANPSNVSYSQYSQTNHSTPFSPVNSSCSSQSSVSVSSTVYPTEDASPPTKSHAKIKDWQVKELEKIFSGEYTCSGSKLVAVSKELKLTANQVRYWLKKKRMNKDAIQ